MNWIVMLPPVTVTGIDSVTAVLCAPAAAKISKFDNTVAPLIEIFISLWPVPVDAMSAKPKVTV